MHNVHTHITHGCMVSYSLKWKLLVASYHMTSSYVILLIVQFMNYYSYTVKTTSYPISMQLVSYMVTYNIMYSICKCVVFLYYKYKIEVAVYS